MISDLTDLVKYIDWTFFFFGWKLSGKYPAIFNDPVKGTEALKLYNDAQQYLKEIIDRKLITAKAVSGLYPAVSVGDDVTSTFREYRNQNQDFPEVSEESGGERKGDSEPLSVGFYCTRIFGSKR